MKNTIRDQHRRLFGADKRGAGREQLATDVTMDGNAGLGFQAIARDPTASSELAAAEDTLALANAIEKLPLEQRRVIELRHFSNLSHAMIAEQLNKTEAAVRMLWVRALRSLQSMAAPPSCSKVGDGRQSS